MITVYILGFSVRQTDDRGVVIIIPHLCDNWEQLVGVPLFDRRRSNRTETKRDKSNANMGGLAGNQWPPLGIFGIPIKDM